MYTSENLKPGTKYDVKAEAASPVGTLLATLTFSTASLQVSDDVGGEEKFIEKEDEESIWLCS